MDNNIAFTASRDPGLQPERTALAWNRTAVMVLANALIIFRGGIIDGSMSLVLLSGVCMFSAVWVWLFGKHRGRQILNMHPDLLSSSNGLWIIAGVSTISCTAGLTAIIVHAQN